MEGTGAMNVFISSVTRSSATVEGVAVYILGVWWSKVVLEAPSVLHQKRPDPNVGQAQSNKLTIPLRRLLRISPA